MYIRFLFMGPRLSYTVEVVCFNFYRRNVIREGGLLCPLLYGNLFLCRGQFLVC